MLRSGRPGFVCASCCCATPRRVGVFCHWSSRGLSTVQECSSDQGALRSFFEGISAELGVREWTDWYNVSWRDVRSRAGGRFPCQGTSSLLEMLQEAYPEFSWQRSRFRRTSRHFWKNPNAQRALLERIGLDLGVNELNDWYAVAHSRVAQMGGRRLLQRYGSLENVLRTIYPHSDWDAQRFEDRAEVGQGYWQDSANLMKALDHAERAMGITQPEDWYSVALTDLRQLGFPTTVSKAGLATLLSRKYPGYRWDKALILKGKYAQQKRLERAVRSLFQGVDMSINARKEAGLVNPDTGDYFEVDIYIPSLKLAFEFQEKHHYAPVEYRHEPLEILQARDRKKKDVAKEKGLTLIVVPFWWDGTLNSLIGTIKKHRPDLFTEADGEPIPEEMPPDTLTKHIPHVDGIGEPATASFFTQSRVDPTNWWIFEKYDGVRGFWNPAKKCFLSRYGKVIPFPHEILDTMPADLYLDGEIWFGRDNFQEAARLANRVNPTQLDWSKFRYMVFDCPTHPGLYHQRYAHLVERLSASPCKYVTVAPKTECRDTGHLERTFQDIIDGGGEGVILRDPASPLRHGRAAGYLKHKKYRDAEARVVGTDGLQWECELPNGIRFFAPAGTTEFAKRWQPKPGDIVTFKHHGFLESSKKPKLPTLHRVRTDLTWTDVTNNWKEQRGTPTSAAPPLRRTPQTKYRAKGYWSSNQNRREFFVSLAAKLGFDPLVPENWNGVTVEQVRAHKGGALFKRYSTLKKALVDTFPEVVFDTTDALHHGRRWHDAAERQRFFGSFAKWKGFDPLATEGWKSVYAEHIKAFGGSGLLIRYNNSLIAALEDTFPELRGQLTTPTPLQRWTPEYTRQFLLGLAQELGIDPSVPESWSKLKRSHIRAHRGGRLLHLHGGDMNALLRNAFPALHL